MTLKEWKEKQDISFFKLGQMLGIKSQNPATTVQRYCLVSKQKNLY